MPEEVQDLLEQLAQDNQVSIDEIKQDLQNLINQAWEVPEDKYTEFRRFFKNKKPPSVFFLYAFVKLQNWND